MCLQLWVCRRSGRGRVFGLAWGNRIREKTSISPCPWFQQRLHGYGNCHRPILRINFFEERRRSAALLIVTSSHTQGSATGLTIGRRAFGPEIWDSTAVQLILHFVVSPGRALSAFPKMCGPRLNVSPVAEALG